jgi:hypothetical protein
VVYNPATPADTGKVRKLLAQPAPER